jgi:hypothetical protein
MTGIISFIGLVGLLFLAYTIGKNSTKTTPNVESEEKPFGFSSKDESNTNTQTQTKVDIIKEYLSKNIDLKNAIINNDQETIDNYLATEDKKDTEEIIKKYMYADKPAEYQRLKAIDTFYDEKDTKKALDIIDNALKIREIETQPLLYAFKAEIFKTTNELDNEFNALSSSYHACLDCQKDFTQLLIENLLRMSEIHSIRKNDEYAMEMLENSIDIANSNNSSNYTFHKIFKRKCEIEKDLNKFDDAKLSFNTYNEYYFKYKNESDADLPF